MRNLIGLELTVLVLAFASTVAAHGPMEGTVSVDPPGASQALGRYLAGIANGDPWTAPHSVLLQIDASLPHLAEQGHLKAIREWPEPQTPDYQVIHIEGDATVKTQVIARYLNAEKRAASLPASSVAITPANYKFRYAPRQGGATIYVFRITPKKKRPGLIKGELWIDGGTGLAVRETGYLVKRPSVFIRRLKITRDISVRDGAPYVRTTHLDIDVRLAGRAEMTISECPCARSTFVKTADEILDKGNSNGITCSAGQ